MTPINRQFSELLKTGNSSAVEKFFIKNRTHIIKNNSAVELLWEFLRLDLNELAFDFIQNTKRFKSATTPEDLNKFELAKMWLYCQMDCYAKALQVIQGIIQRCPPEKKYLYYRYLATVYLYQEDWTKALEALLLFKEHHPEQVQSADVHFLSDLALCYFWTGEAQKAKELIFSPPAESTLGIEDLRRLYLSQAIIIGGSPFNQFEQAKGLFEKSIALMPDVQFNRPYWFYFGEMLARQGKKTEAVEAYKKAIIKEKSHPQSANARTYRALIQLGEDKMPAFKTIPAYCHPLNDNQEDLNRFFQVTNNKVTIVNYEPQSKTQENCFDLVAGQIFFKKKITWLTDLQAKLLLYVIASGEIGIHVLQLEWMLFNVMFKNESTGIQRIEKLIKKFKAMGIQIERRDNYLYYTPLKDFTYILPGNANFIGAIAVLKKYENFQRVDVERELHIGKTMATLYIRQWLKKNQLKKSLVRKIPTYSVI